MTASCGNPCGTAGWRETKGGTGRGGEGQREGKGGMEMDRGRDRERWRGTEGGIRRGGDGQREG